MSQNLHFINGIIKCTNLVHEGSIGGIVELFRPGFSKTLVLV